jgi:hypothetical protein
VEFVISPPDIVRSSNQLWLLKSWMRLRRPGRLPALEGFLGEELVGIADNLLLMDVVDRDGKARYMIRFGGTRITEYFGCPSGGQGRFLDASRRCDGATKAVAPRPDQNICEKIQYRLPEISIAAGKVSTQAMAIFRIVDNCSPDPLAVIVPAMPDDRTCVVDTGSPKPSAAAMVAAAVISAQAPCA